MALCVLRGLSSIFRSGLPTFEQWYGVKDGRRYVQRYRTRVLGQLAGVKLCEGDFRQWWNVVRHVVTQNRRSLIELAMLWYMIGRFVVRMCVCTSSAKKGGGRQNFSAEQEQNFCSSLLMSRKDGEENSSVSNSH